MVVGHVWRGACVATGVCSRGMCGGGDMHGGGHAWWGGMHGRRYAWQESCIAGGVHGRGHAWQQAYVAGGMHGGGCAWQRGYMGGWHAWQGACMAGEMATAADGTHPTGMPSCCLLFLLNACLVALIFSVELLSEAQFSPYETLETIEFSNLQGKELLMPSLPPIR